MGKTYEVTYLDTHHKTQTIITDNIIAFYQRVRQEGLTVVRPPKVIRS